MRGGSKKLKPQTEELEEGKDPLEGQKDNNLLDPAEIGQTAANYYRRGDFYCSEAILKAIKDAFQLPVPETIIGMASGFPIGMGRSGCTCGAIAGGILALGLFFGRVEPKDRRVHKAMALSKELHDWFRARHGQLCCRILTKNMRLGSPAHMRQCTSFTGEVAEATAKMILRELTGQNSNGRGQWACPISSPFWG